MVLEILARMAVVVTVQAVAAMDQITAAMETAPLIVGFNSCIIPIRQLRDLDRDWWMGLL